nr:hypothetical protein [Tanacetum cinerariifolium]
MDDPNITMADYIQLEEEKAHRRGQEFNWETTTYGKVRYFEDIDYFKDFENQFPAIVYNDTPTSESEVSSDFENETLLNKNDDFGRVFIFWNSVGCSHAAIPSESSNSEGITAIVKKLENLGRDMKKLKENVHAIQVGCQICGGAHLDIDCPLNKEIKSVEEVKFREFGRPFPKNDGRFNRGRYDQPSSGERRPNLTEIINKYMEEASKRHTEQEEWLKKYYQSTEASREAHDKIIQGLETKEIKYFSANSGFSDNERQETNDSGMAEALAALEATIKKKKEEPKREKQNVNYYVDPYEPPIPFPRRLEKYAEESLDLVENKPRTDEEKEIKMNPRSPDLLQNHLPPKEQDPGSFILPRSIGKLDFKNALADLGASISIMPFSMYKHLGIGKLKLINMIIEIDDNTKCTPKGIV